MEASGAVSRRVTARSQGDAGVRSSPLRSAVGSAHAIDATRWLNRRLAPVTRSLDRSWRFLVRRRESRRGIWSDRVYRVTARPEVGRAIAIRDLVAHGLE